MDYKAFPQISSNLIKDLKKLNWVEYSSKKTIWVRTSEQSLYVLDQFYLLNVFPCSTGMAGLGNKLGSMCTPLGWHEIAEKIGDNLPLGSVFRERQWTGKIWGNGDDFFEEELILTRILWLSGLEDGRNKGGDFDTYGRYIYIHGTNQEKFIGTPKSKGCIRLKNKDIIQLFDIVEPKGRVLISI